MIIEQKILLNIHLTPYHSVNLAHFQLEQRKWCQKGIIIKWIRKKIYLDSAKLNGAERAKISISPMIGPKLNR
jgi:hypothetical protein